jgi:hypothetical protein
MFLLVQVVLFLFIQLLGNKWQQDTCAVCRIHRFVSVFAQRQRSTLLHMLIQFAAATCQLAFDMIFQRFYVSPQLRIDPSVYSLN